MTRYSTLRLLVLLTTSLAPSLLWGVNSSYVINIDNPSYRRLIVGVPEPEIQPATDSELSALSRQIQSEMLHLLEFTNLFRVLGRDAFLGKSVTSLKGAAKHSAGDDQVLIERWRATGVEGLTQGRLLRQATGLRLELWTIDMGQNKRILSKAYRLWGAKDIKRVLRRYVDRLLETYTGKPGIFSTRLVFVGKKTKGSNKQIYTCDIDGGNLQQITSNKTLHLSPSWNPRGEKIVFTSYRNRKPDLYLYDLKTRQTSKLADLARLNSGGAFSPNGKLVAFTGSTDGNAEIYLTNLADRRSQKILVGRGLDVDPMFSPDGKWLVFVSGRWGNPHIFRAELDWKSEQSIRVKSHKRLTFAGWYNATPAWSPDSKTIAFAGFDKDIGRFDLFIMNMDGTNLERLTLESGDNESPSWSPNGQMLVFHSNRIGNTNRKGPSQLYLMNKDGTQQKRIPLGLYDAQTPKWGPYLIPRLRRP